MTIGPHVILVVGVNGTGKTTTIGKIAHRLRQEGKSVMLAAGDTFRAAAIDQLKIWGERTGAEVVARAVGADSAGLAFDALTRAREKKCDVLLIDTAGRLQNKQALMDELEKVLRVLRKIDPSAPHQVLLVLDATTGQNALNQVEVFKDKAGVTGPGHDQARRHGAGRYPGRNFGEVRPSSSRHRRWGRRRGPVGIRRERVCARHRAELRIEEKGEAGSLNKEPPETMKVAIETMNWRRRYFPFNAEQTVNILGEIGPLVRDVPRQRHLWHCRRYLGADRHDRRFPGGLACGCWAVRRSCRSSQAL